MNYSDAHNELRRMAKIHAIKDDLKAMYHLASVIDMLSPAEDYYTYTDLEERLRRLWNKLFEIDVHNIRIGHLVFLPQMVEKGKGPMVYKLDGKGREFFLHKAVLFITAYPQDDIEKIFIALHCK